MTSGDSAPENWGVNRAGVDPLFLILEGGDVTTGSALWFSFHLGFTSSTRSALRPPTGMFRGRGWLWGPERGREGGLTGVGNLELPEGPGWRAGPVPGPSCAEAAVLLAHHPL